MTKAELVKVVAEYAKNNNDLPSWANTIGVRYDDKVVSVGEELECSRDNSDREDSRDFPKFGDEDFDNLPRLPGTSAYTVCEADCFDPEDDDDDDFDMTWAEYVNGQEDSAWAHCSIVIGKKSCDYWVEDEGEVILEGCEVVKVIW